MVKFPKILQIKNHFLFPEFLLDMAYGVACGALSYVCGVSVPCLWRVFVCGEQNLYLPQNAERDIYSSYIHKTSSSTADRSAGFCYYYFYFILLLNCGILYWWWWWW